MINELIRLIERLPEPEAHIYHVYDEGSIEWVVTSEWLVGTFAGRCFTGQTKENAVEMMIEYFNAHPGNPSMVGGIVRDSGWPNLDKVEKYLRES